MNYGASKDDWLHFDLVLGLTEDILPVVSNPNAEISGKSTMRSTGKTPSKYNKDRKVTGLPNWTTFKATSAYVERMSKEADYGICIQTRRVRAIDVDVKDPVLSAKIKNLIKSIWPVNFPCRYRADSSKFLLMFDMPGEFTKQIIRLKSGDIIEFLANGQQFIAVGTHPDGARYKWENGLPLEIPVLSADQFDHLWQTLASELDGEIVQSNELKARDQSNKDASATDEIAEFLDQHWEVFSFGKAGERYIRCPFEHEHTSDSGETSTAYFPKSTGGFELGHFRCLHAHCEGRNDGDFRNAIGFGLSDFEVVKLEDNAPKPLPNFDRDDKGAIKTTTSNLYKAVGRSDMCGIQIRFDVFRDEIMYAPHNTSDQWVAFTDSDYTRLRITLENNSFKPIGRELARDVVLLVANENPFDSAIAWINGLKWDGVHRCESFLSRYFNAGDSEYTRAVSLYVWTALAGRVLSPGVKADMVPILVGEQGCGKSTGVAAISPDPNFFCEISFAEKDDDLSRKMRGRLVGEIGELRGLNSKDIEGIKAFVTRTHESWIPKYREFATQFPRRLVFIGTTNQPEFLADETGNRRWLPVDVSNVDVQGVKNDCLQLWAEAKELFNTLGVQYDDAERLAVEVHDQYTIKDIWADTVSNWLNTPDPIDNTKPIDRPYLRINEVLREALGLDPRNIGRRDEMRMSKTLQSLDFKCEVAKVNGKSLRVYKLKSYDLPQPRG